MNRGQARGSARGGRGSANRGPGRGNPRDGRRSQPPVRRSAQSGAGIYESSANDFSGNKEDSSKGEMGSPQEMFPRSFPKNPEHKPTSSSQYQKEWRPSDKKDLLSNAERLKQGSNSIESMEVIAKELKSSVAPYSEYRKEWRPSAANYERLEDGSNSTESLEVNSKELKCSAASDSGHNGPNLHYLHLHKGQRTQIRETPSKSTGDSETYLPSLNLSQNLHKGVQGLQMGETPSKKTGDCETYLPSKSEAKHGYFSINSPLPTSSHQKPEHSEQSAVDPSFDLCPIKSGSAVTLKAPLLVQNRERRNEIKRSMEQPNQIVLQSGMVLLKSFISPNDQIKIVKLCRDLGLGPGGFYQPGYRDGAKLNLKMMCLGKNWDPETSKYGDHRPHDGAKPPSIPIDFLRLVEDAIKDSHSLIRKNSRVGNCEDILPPVSPDICLVNFYASTGRLGLHQDCDESEQSLRKRLPVVSFSIGDAAEFLYGDQRDVESANKVKLETGDVLIFGGKSRHIFHGVASIQPNTAPKSLLEATKLRSGRLNLTFREY